MIEPKQIRDATVREVIRHLTKNATDPARIGRRVLAWAHTLRREAEREKVKEFARRLGVSSPRASVALADAEAALFEVRNVISSGPPA